MAIKKLTKTNEAEKYVGEQLERMQRALVYNLQYIGEQCVAHARSLPSPPAKEGEHPHQPHYIDRTGNLRSSIGYVVAIDGKVVEGNRFPRIKGGAEGANEGAAFAADIAAREFPNGVVLVVVAGMNYAAHLSARGYDVLDSSEVLAARLVPQLLQTLGFEVR